MSGVRRRVSALRTRIRGLPSFARFAPLLLQAGLGRIVKRRGGDGGMAWIRSLPADCTVVQQWPADPVATLSLAEACRRSRRRILVEAPAAHQAGDRELAQFAAWHRSIILGYALPHIEVADRDNTAIGTRFVIVDGDGVRQ